MASHSSVIWVYTKSMASGDMHFMFLGRYETISWNSSSAFDFSSSAEEHPPDNGCWPPTTMETVGPENRLKELVRKESRAAKGYALPKLPCRMKLGVVCIRSVATEEPVTSRINQHFSCTFARDTSCSEETNEANASHDI